MNKAKVAFVFSIFFTAIGVFMGWWVVSSLLEYRAMQGWVETPAWITKAELEVEHGEGAMYEAVAEYRYEFAGRPYQGSRVGINSGRDNLSRFQKRVHRELKAHQSAGTVFRCFVNPAAPEQSILYRDLRFEMIAFNDVFVLCFGGAGGGLLVWSLFALRAERWNAALAAKHPDKPWLWREDWAANEIQTTNAQVPAATTAGALFANLVTLPLWWMLPSELVRGKIGLFSLPPLVIGPILAVVALLAWYPRYRYGRSLFRITNPRAVIGNELTGVIETSRPIDCDQFHVVLLCQRKVEKGEDSETHEVSRYEQTVASNSSPTWGDTGTSIPVRFELDDSCRPTGKADDGTIVWTLTAKSGSAWTGFKAEFEVPVFRS